jgi:hypothetical protein
MVNLRVENSDYTVTHDIGQLDVQTAFAQSLLLVQYCCYNQRDAVVAFQAAIRPLAAREQVRDTEYNIT